MLARFEHARVLDVGTYDIDGASYRWIDLYDPESREKVLRVGVHREVPDYAFGFGDYVDFEADVAMETKSLRDSTQTYARCKVSVHAIAASKSRGNGKTEATPTPVAG